MIGGRGSRKPVFLKRARKDGELVILCRSESRREKESAMLSRTEEKYLRDLALLAEKLKSPNSKLRHNEAVQRSIGRIHIHRGIQGRRSTTTYASRRPSGT